MITHKRCTGCLAVLPLSDFHNNKHAKGGKHERCKECVKRQNKVYRAPVWCVLNKYCWRCKEHHLVGKPVVKCPACGASFKLDRMESRRYLGLPAPRNKE